MCFAWLVLALAAASHATITWRQTNPSLTSSQVTSLANNGKIFVAMTTNINNLFAPEILTSSGTSGWTAPTLPQASASTTAFAMAFAPNIEQFCIYGAGGVVWMSADGLQWRLVTLRGTEFYNPEGLTAVYANGVILVSSPGDDMVYVSSDCVSFEGVALPGASDGAMGGGVIVSGGQFVAWQNDGSSYSDYSGYVWYSDDAQTWTERNISSFDGTTEMVSLPAAGASAAIATVSSGESNYTSTLYVSTSNGASFEKVYRFPGSSKAGSLQAAGAYLVYTDREKIFMSGNGGHTFTPYTVHIGRAANQPYSFTQKGGLYFALGNEGFVASTTDFAKGPWRAVKEGIEGYFFSVDAFGDQFVLTVVDRPSGPPAQGASYASADGASWRQFASIAPGNVFVGNGVLCIQPVNNRSVVATADLATFETYEIAPLYPDEVLVGLSYAGDYYFFCGTTALNATAYTTRLYASKELSGPFDVVREMASSTNQTIIQVAYSAGVYAVTDNYENVFAVSEDLATWTVPNSNWMLVDLYSEGSLMYATDVLRNTMWASGDGGATWAVVITAFNVTNVFEVNAYADDMYFATFNFNEYVFAVSTDGLVFQNVSFPPINDVLYGVAAAGNTVVAVADDAFVWAGTRSP